jgi:hypothetical protein
LNFFRQIERSQTLTMLPSPSCSISPSLLSGGAGQWMNLSWQRKRQRFIQNFSSHLGWFYPISYPSICPKDPLCQWMNSKIKNKTIISTSLASCKSEKAQLLRFPCLSPHRPGISTWHRSSPIWPSSWAVHDIDT